VDGAQHLLVFEDVPGQRGALVRPDAELREVGAELARGLQALEQARPRFAVGRDQATVGDRQARGWGGEPDRREALRSAQQGGSARGARAPRHGTFWAFDATRELRR
jgi:hypothetical protein